MHNVMNAHVPSAIEDMVTLGTPLNKSSDDQEIVTETILDKSLVTVSERYDGAKGKTLESEGDEDGELIFFYQAKFCEYRDMVDPHWHGVFECVVYALQEQFGRAAVGNDVTAMLLGSYQKQSLVQGQHLANVPPYTLAGVFRVRSTLASLIQKSQDEVQHNVRMHTHAWSACMRLPELFSPGAIRFTPALSGGYYEDYAHLASQLDSQTLTCANVRSEKFSVCAHTKNLVLGAHKHGTKSVGTFWADMKAGTPIFVTEK